MILVNFVGVTRVCDNFLCFQIIAFAALVAVAVAAPQNRDADAVVLKYDSDNIGVDGYNFA